MMTPLKRAGRSVILGLALLFCISSFAVLTLPVQDERCVGYCLLKDPEEWVGYVYLQMPFEPAELQVIIKIDANGLWGERIAIDPAWLGKFYEALKKNGKDAYQLQPAPQPAPLEPEIMPIQKPEDGITQSI